MSFRELALPSGTVILQAPQEAHSKTVDYSHNRIKQLGGIPSSMFGSYDGDSPCIAVIDTETTCETGDNFGKPLIYDIGVTFVRASDGVPVAKADFIIEETFCNAQLMKGAFFTNRVFTDYPYILAEGIANLCTFSTAIDHLSHLFLKYNVGTFSAYNSNFDTKAFDKTAMYLERIDPETLYHKGLVSDIRNGTIDVLDLWALSCMLFMCHDEYKEQAFNKGWFTKGKDKFSTNAEAANNFIKGSEVGEDHTALSDTAIEANIYRFCLTQPDAQEVIKLCLNGHGETWGFVNNQGADSVRAWVLKNHPDKLETYNNLVR